MPGRKCIFRIFRAHRTCLVAANVVPFLLNVKRKLQIEADVVNVSNYTLLCNNWLLNALHLHLFHNKPYSTAKRKKTVEQDRQG